MSLNMFPSMALQNVVNSSLGNSKIANQITFSMPCFKKATNQFHYCLGQFGMTIRFTFWSFFHTSTFFIHILNVIELSSYEKMRWSTTNPVIAFVTNKKTVRDFSMNKLPCNSMSGRFFRFHSWVMTNAITIMRLTSFPYPTTLSFFNEFPKSKFQRDFLPSFERIFQPARSALFCFKTTQMTAFTWDRFLWHCLSI